MASAACTQEKSHSLNVQNLKILYSQNESLESVIRQKDWKPLTSPFKIRLPFSHTELFRHVWIKGELNISDDPSKYAGITMDKYFCADRVYINNVYIGNSPIRRSIDILLPAAYTIPQGILKKGKNEIHIRLGLWRNIPGGVRASSITVHSRDDYANRVFWNDILFRQIIFGILFLFAAFFLISLIKFIFSRDRLYLFFIFGSLLSCLQYIELYISYESIGLVHLLTFPCAVSPLIVIFLILIIQHMYRMYLSQQNRIVIPLLGLMSIMILFSRMLPVLPSVSELINILLFFGAILIGCSFCIYLLSRLNSIRPSKSILYFNSVYITIFTILVILIVIVSEFLAIALGFGLLDTLRIYTQPLLLVPYFIYEAVIIKRRKLELEQLYSTLREQKKNTKPSKPTITDASEEKLERVIEFIKENYTSDLSREGLASAVDINPNYLSTLFVAYTGKKLQEYINSLRVKDAVTRLQETDKRIIDIAFSTGFENLGTFIRAFKVETGSTPSEYREKMKQRN